jgi:hypothetical protein
MGRLYVVIVWCLVLASCSGSNESNVYPHKPSDDTTPNFVKTIFQDSAYQISLTIFDTTVSDPDFNNAVFSLYRKEAEGDRLLLSDSLYSMSSDIEFQDFNNDKIEDVLVFYYSGGRANPTYHLYLVNKVGKFLTKVKGFENMPNPSLDTSLNIISSIALSGSNKYSFYRINERNELIDLGHSYFEDPADSLQYEKAIKSILQDIQ